MSTVRGWCPARRRAGRGPTGIGKAALLDAACAQARARGAQGAAGAGRGAGVGFAFGLVRQLFARRLQGARRAGTVVGWPGTDVGAAGRRRGRGHVVRHRVRPVPARGRPRRVTAAAGRGGRCPRSGGWAISRPRAAELDAPIVVASRPRPPRRRAGGPAGRAPPTDPVPHARAPRSVRTRGRDRLRDQRRARPRPRSRRRSGRDPGLRRRQRRPQAVLRIAGVLLGLLAIGFLGVVGIALATPSVATSVGLGDVTPFVVPGAAAPPPAKAPTAPRVQVAKPKPKPRPVQVDAASPHSQPGPRRATPGHSDCVGSDSGTRPLTTRCSSWWAAFSWVINCSRCPRSNSIWR